ncbi:DUF3892 domain-containing protein [Puia dinghuensis]|uniref:DUF3892 domain-containing protein n=1 Tax=Puia dinghuensis TaxID=1792502 RepID=A0A8J2XSL9_9BACT|nr:DUF3892 domain-containing protein [Puia dinghuensis]GGA96347.1 hypothetical protein GCM10011511_19560 [Puia dinghuensis]
MAVRITCIRKGTGFYENQHTAITDLGWINEETKVSGLSTRLQIYEFLEQGGQAYVVDPFGVRAYLTRAQTDQGTKFVKTAKDQSTADNLLNLGPCAGSL